PLVVLELAAPHPVAHAHRHPVVQRGEIAEAAPVAQGGADDLFEAIDDVVDGLRDHGSSSPCRISLAALSSEKQALSRPLIAEPRSSDDSISNREATFESTSGAGGSHDGWYVARGVIRRRRKGGIDGQRV